MVGSYSCVYGQGRRVSGRTQDSGPGCVCADTSARPEPRLGIAGKPARCSNRVRPFTGTAEPRVYPRTSRRLRALAPADVMATHDLQEAGVIGKAQSLRRPRDVPVVVLQGCDDDLALRLRFEGVECGRCGAPCSAGPRTRAFLDVGVDVLHTDRLAIRRDDHPLDDIPELSDVVPRPVVSHQAVERRRVDRLGSYAEARTGHHQEMLDECGDVRQPLSERRDADYVDVESEVDVLAEAAGPYFGLEVAVRGGHDARRHGDRPIPTESGDLPLFDDAQQLRLRRGRQFTDLVEKQRTAGRGFERALAERTGARERPPLVAEQLILHEVLRDGRGIERDERSRRVRAQTMQLTGDELLPRPALAHDQDRTRDLRDAPDRVLERLHGGARAHERGLGIEAAP